MAYKCDKCGKGVQYGHNVSHSKRRTRKIFKPNLHWARIYVAGKMERMFLCTKCLRLVKEKAAAKNESVKTAPEATTSVAAS
ncbi:50S ribosomal protein L28 [Candidatus Microgenomates bacterium]|nr:50S ribosomal protein L28 [Candidatus Microgenomates bacterium]